MPQLRETRLAREVAYIVRMTASLVSYVAHHLEVLDRRHRDAPTEVQDMPASLFVEVRSLVVQHEKLFAFCTDSIRWLILPSGCNTVTLQVGICAASLPGPMSSYENSTAPRMFRTFASSAVLSGLMPSSYMVYSDPDCTTYGGDPG